MKRILSLVLAGIFMVGLTACGSLKATLEDGNADESKAVETSSNEDMTGDSVLVVYYSATGNTEDVAEKIADVTGGDVFEITPTEPYTDEDLDWTESDSRVSVEHDDESMRDVELTTTTVENWDEYDTVYLGYPVWWGIAAWPVNTFVQANDFSGKTIIPFATAASSGMGESGELLQEMAKTGNWLEGECFRGSISEDDVSEWIDTLK